MTTDSSVAWRFTATAATAAVAASAALLSACGGSDTPAPAPAPAPVLTAQQACDALAKGTVAAADIALPTTGAAITAASLVASTATVPEYCKLTGAIRPVAAGAPSINFQLNLPTAWNSKALQLGGGGFDGNVPDTLGAYNFAPTTDATPLAKGYATFASDSGHQAASPGDASFALNAEALDNFTGSQVKKTRDTVVALLKQRYGSGPKRTYFVGGSEGGREALLAVQRWPQDYDGVISHLPAYNFSSIMLNGNRMAKAIYSNAGAGWLSPAKLSFLNSSMLAACDALDAVDGTTKDGLISNPAACAQVFNLSALRCSGGADTGNSCLSDPQIATLNAFNTPTTLPATLANGATSYPAYTVFGAMDFGLFSGMGSKAVPNSPPIGGPAGDAALFALSDGFIRYFVQADASVDSLKFDPTTTASKARLQALSTAMDASQDDITAFQQRGGKLLLSHGSSDTLVSTNGSSAYFDRLRTRFGAALDNFVQYYVIPGLGHGTGSFVPGWRSLDALEQWVEAGVVPANLTATDSPAAGSRPALGSRPLCQYGTWPQFVSGDVTAASSYRCTGTKK